MIPRLRMFAGPNGSGKSTLAEWLSKNYSVNLYHYVNADMMFAEISDTLKTAGRQRYIAPLAGRQRYIAPLAGRQRYIAPLAGTPALHRSAGQQCSETQKHAGCGFPFTKTHPIIIFPRKMHYISRSGSAWGRSLHR